MFSFDPIKTITCIDGGALVLRTQEEVSMVHEMRLVGMGQPAAVMYQNQRAWTYDVRRLGFRYHMANLHAAIGLAQLRKMDRISESRRAAGRYYNARLSGVPGVRVPKTDFEDITPFLYYIRVPASARDALRTFLTERGVDNGIHWQPGHWFTLLKNCRRGDLSVTDRVGKEILSLPFHSCMAQSDMDRVIESIQEFFHR
jgi:dTDP-4-amino-4,6-dideoxygalactose transaminase